LQKLTIFIQCYNRPTYAKYAIESVLRQTNQDFRLIISDNSSNDELFRLIQAEFPTLEYRRRVPSLPALDHFNKSISEADTDFLCLFHDDDLMEAGFVEAMLNTIALYPDAVAYSCNGVTIENEVVRKGLFFESAEPHVIINNPCALGTRYFSKYPSGFPAFPAYIYRTSLVKHIPIDGQTGGKYSDVTWLLEIAKHGCIVWNTDILIRYRMHASNDSGVESLKDRLRLLGFLKLNRAFVGQTVINDYRFGLYKNLKKSLSANSKLSARSAKFIKRFLLAHRLKRFTRPETYAYLRYKLVQLLRWRHATK
jgi:glycosyltransferase involved in cell wall biosynthesis